VPARRKKRQYISSILAKNEIDRDDPYNRKLFLRWRRGEYIINPRLSLRIEGEWRRIFDVLSPQRLGAQLRDPLRWGDHLFDLNASAEQSLDSLRAHLQALSDGRTLAELLPGSRR
jgi:hypothetical protein